MQHNDVLAILDGSASNSGKRAAGQPVLMISTDENAVCAEQLMRLTALPTKRFNPISLDSTQLPPMF